MFLLGLLSLLQTALLPGLLVVLYLRLYDGLLKLWILSFILSIAINFFLVAILTTLHLYYPVTLYSIFLVELLLLFWRINALSPQEKTSLFSIQLIHHLSYNDIHKRIINSTPLRLWLIIFAAIILIYYFSYIISNPSSIIFSHWDPVVSWNRWATDWAKNSFPTYTWHYPQLLPVNWSISYLLIGTTKIQFFAKAIMPLFSFTLLLIMLDLWLRTKQLGYLCGLIITGMLIFKLYKNFIGTGYADIPVATMGFAVVYLLLLARNAISYNNLKKILLIGAFVSAAAAMTKQAGIYIALFYPLLAYILVLHKQDSILTKQKLNLLVMSLFIIIAFATPWYIYKEIQIYKGLDVSEIHNLTETIHQGLTLLQRLTYSIHMLSGKLGHLLLYFFLPITIITAFVTNRTARWLTLLIVVPYFFIWAFYYSYDDRNLALAIPVIGLVSGFGLMPYINSLDRLFSRLSLAKQKQSYFYFSLAIIVISLLFLNSYFYTNKLLHQQLALQKEISNRNINYALYDYFSNKKLTHKILSNYQILAYLPGFEKAYTYESFQNSKALLNKINTLNAKYLVIMKGGDTKPKPNVIYFIKHNTNQRFTIILNAKGFIFVKIRSQNVTV